MDVRQINQKLFNNPITKRYYKGCYAADKIPPIDHFPASLVVNMDNSDKPGSHWVAMYMPRRNSVYYFDSFGLMPYNKHIVRFLRRFKHVTRQTTVLQSIASNVCGAYVVFFIHLCSLGFTMRSITRLLKDCKCNKDLFVARFVNKNV